MEREDSLSPGISQSISIRNEKMHSICAETIFDNIPHQSMACGGNLVTEHCQWLNSGDDAPYKRELYHYGSNTHTFAEYKLQKGLEKGNLDIRKLLKLLITQLAATAMDKVNRNIM
jgi:hypothetical protein